MSFWNSTLLGVLVGGAITSATQYAAFWRQDRRETLASASRATAEWNAMQMATITDLQESLEQGASAISNVLVEGATSRFGRFKLPDMVPLTRALMLCSRLEDADLARDVRAWIVDNRATITVDEPLQADWGAIRDRRIELQDRLGDALKAYHGR